MNQPELALPFTSNAELCEKAREPPCLDNAGRVDERTLKIEETGDFWRRKITPKIRLSGQWLARAGFKPGHRVRVKALKPGELTLQYIESP